MAAAISTYCLDISAPKTTIGLLADYRLYTARWSLADLLARRQPPTPAPDPDRQTSADLGEPAVPRPPGQDAGEWEIPRIPLQYDRAVLAGAVVREQLRATTATAVRGRAYDVVADQQAAMPEQLLAPEPADPEHDDQEPEPGRREAIDMTALRALRESRTDVEALGSGCGAAVLPAFCPRNCAPGSTPGRKPLKRKPSGRRTKARQSRSATSTTCPSRPAGAWVASPPGTRPTRIPWIV